MTRLLYQTVAALAHPAVTAAPLNPLVSKIMVQLRLWHQKIQVFQFHQISILQEPDKDKFPRLEQVPE